MEVKKSHKLKPKTGVGLKIWLLGTWETSASSNGGRPKKGPGTDSVSRKRTVGYRCSSGTLQPDGPDKDKDRPKEYEKEEQGEREAV